MIRDATDGVAEPPLYHGLHQELAALAVCGARFAHRGVFSRAVGTYIIVTVGLGCTIPVTFAITLFLSFGFDFNFGPCGAR